MRKPFRTVLLGVCALIVGPLALPSSAAPSPADAGPTPVADGFAAPLHLSHTGDALYVADAFAGTVWQVDPATGAKAPAPGGTFRTGTFVTGVDAAARGGGYYVTLTRPGGGTALVKVGADGERRQLADLLRYERRTNPDGQPQLTGQRADQLSNPYDVLAVRGDAYVADAAGNAVLFVSDSGTVRTVAVLPVSRRGACAEMENNGVPGGGCDPVPTDLFMPADGFLYVAGLGSEVEGLVWKIDPDTGRIVRSWRGFAPLAGVAVDEDGNVYASSLFGGTVTRVTPGGRRSAVEVPGATGLALHDGRLYVGSLDLAGGPGSVQRVGTWAFR